jgi:hypothetical protein
MCLKIKFCNHQRPGRTRLLKSLYPSKQPCQNRAPVLCLLSSISVNTEQWPLPFYSAHLTFFLRLFMYLTCLPPPPRLRSFYHSLPLPSFISFLSFSSFVYFRLTQERTPISFVQAHIPLCHQKPNPAPERFPLIQHSSCGGSFYRCNVATSHIIYAIWQYHSPIPVKS